MVMIADMLMDDENESEEAEVSIPDDVLEEITEDTDEEDAPDTKPVVADPIEEEEEAEDVLLKPAEDDEEDVDFDTHDDIDPI